MTKKTLLIFNVALMMVVLFTAFQVNAVGSKEKVVCPVSGEKLLKSDAVGPVAHDGHDYYFCCEGCVEKFNKNPEKYSLEMVSKDPICGMEVDKDSQHTHIQDGKKYHFCSTQCKSRFMEESKSDAVEGTKKKCGPCCKKECCQSKENDK